jgi:hypothetical protein
MFGLALIVFSFYFRDNHLNRFDTKQNYFKRDSIESIIYVDDWNRKDDIFYESESGLSMLIDEIDSQSKINPKMYRMRRTLLYSNLDKVFRRLNWKDLSTIGKLINLEDKRYDYFYNKISNVSTINYSTREEHILISNLLMRVFVVGKKMFYDYNFIKDNIKESENYYRFLLYCGLLLFIPGTILWYFKIQKPQDELLKMQLVEAKKKSGDAESKISIGSRKHFEPKILPRPEVRSRL